MTTQTSSTFNADTFWTDFLTLLEGGNRTSDPKYYVDGKAQEGEWANIIAKVFERTGPGSAEREQLVQLLDDAGFWADTDDRNYWLTVDANDPAFAGDIATLEAAGEERLPNLFGGPGGTPGVDPTGGVGPDPDTQLKIMSSPTLKYYKDPNTGKWYASYKLPNSDRFVFFDVTEDQLTSMFGGRPPQAESRTFRSLTGDSKFTYSGNIAEMAGEGKFEDEVAHVIALGLEDGKLPEWASQDPEILDLIYIAQAEQKSNDWLIDKIATTNSFKVRFPHIETLKNRGNLTYGEAVTGFLEYESQLRTAVQATGMSPDTVTPDAVGSLLERGYSVEASIKGISVLDRANKYAPALNAFNAVLTSAGYDPITDVQGMFDFMAGAAPTEVYDLWEASSVSEAANAAGLGGVYSAEDAIAFAMQSQGNVSLADATSAFQSAAQLLLRMRSEVDVERYGLTTDELIDMSLGMPPRSGRSAADIQENMNRAVLSAHTSLQKQANPFVGFSASGTPQRASFGGLREGS